MRDFRYIELERTRDFSEKVTTSLSFIVQNFRSLFKSLLFIAGPPVLVVSILIGSFISDFFALSFQAGRGNADAMTNFFTSVNLWIQIFLVFIFFIVSVVITTATANCYLMLYREKRTNQIDVNDVWTRVRATFWTYLGTTILFGVLAIIAYVVLLIPTFLLGVLSPFLVIFGVFFLIGAFIYLYISASLVYVVQTFENKSFFDALGRSFYLTRGKWWSTFGTWMVLALLVSVISGIFFIPAYAVLIVSSLHNLDAANFSGPSGFAGFFVTLFMTLYYLCQMVLTCMPNMGLAFQYFNLVELKEAKGLLGQINTIGTTPEPPRDEEHY